MSSKEKGKTVLQTEPRDFDYLQGLTEEELDDLLDMAADLESGNEIDDVLISAILDELERRGDSLSYKFPDDEEVEAAFQRFKQQMEKEGLWPDPARKKRQRWIRRTVATAAVVTLALFTSFYLATADANAGSYNFWNKLVSWTKETFQFANSQMPEGDKPILQEEALAIFDDLNAALKENDIAVSLPTWVPEGYQAKDAFATGEGHTKVAVGWFGKGQEEFSIEIRSIDDVAAQSNSAFTQDNFEESIGKGEVYRFGRVEHYIAANEMDGIIRYSVVWQQGDNTIKIQGNLSEVEVKTMINSIYERVPNE